MSLPCRNWQSFLGLLRYALGSQTDIPDVQPEEWKDIWNMSEQQTVMGILFNGIEKLRNEGESITIPKDILLRWIFFAEQIRQQNVLLNQRCVELTAQLQKDGFDSCILKGQGNATLYDVRCKKEDGRCMALLRQPGDIDVWVISKSDVRCKREEIIEYAKKQDSKTEVRYYHVEYEWKGVPVELHFMPGIMNNPVYNRRLQKFYGKMAEGGCMMAELPDGVGSIPIPTVEFNIVFQLAHMMHHFFDEGIGLRQMIDYYYLLRNAKGDVRSKMSDVRETLKYLNLYKFAGAVMYIMKDVLGLEEKYLLTPVDENRGKTLLNEVLHGGNFGRSSQLTKHSIGVKHFLKIWRNMHFVREYPAEVLCEPIFRTWHFFWRMRFRE